MAKGKWWELEFTVIRSQWLRGEEDSYLRDSADGRMCCLGFLGLACGLKLQDIEGSQTPKEVNYADWPEGILNEYNDNSEIADDLMNVNDDRTNDAYREATLTELFESIGIKVTFVD